MRTPRTARPPAEWLINDLLATADGGLAVAADSGLYVLAPDRSEWLRAAPARQLKSATEDIVTVLAELPGGELLLGTRKHGILAVAPEGDLRVWSTEADGLADSFVSALLPLTEGRLLAGTYGGGLSLFGFAPRDNVETKTAPPDRDGAAGGVAPASPLRLPPSGRDGPRERSKGRPSIMRIRANRPNNRRAVPLAAALAAGILALAASASRASSVAVALDGVDPDPSWLGRETLLHATALFTADGAERTQETLGWHEEYRWKWRISPDGDLLSTAPAAAPGGEDWTEWSADPVSTCTVEFAQSGAKSADVEVETRMVAADGTPADDTFTARDDTVFDVVELEDAGGLRATSVGYNSVSIAWEHS